MDLFIDITQQPDLKILTDCYRSTEAQLAKVEEALALVQVKVKQRLPRDLPINRSKGYQKREREYEVAYLKMEFENAALHESILKLIETTDSLARSAADWNRSRERYCRVGGSLVSNLYPTLLNNIVCARDLIEAATTMFYRIKIRPPEGSTAAKYHFAIEDAFKQQPDRGRYFFVEASTLKGKYNFDKDDDISSASTVRSGAVDLKLHTCYQMPSPPYMTEDEAKREEDSLEIQFSTIGGSFRVRDLREFEIKKS